MAAVPGPSWTNLGLGILATRLASGDWPGALWLVNATVPPSPGAEWVLSQPERARADRFHTDKLRNRFVTGHCALRLLLEHCFGVPVLKQTFALGPFGKPRLNELLNAQFSLSYSGDRVLLGLAWGLSIGVDIEIVRSVDGAQELASDLFTSSELCELKRCDPMSRSFDQTFLEIWARKEACVKAAGLGLGQSSLSQIASGAGGGLTAVRIGDYHLRTDTTLIDHAYVGAWAVGTESPHEAAMTRKVRVLPA